MAHRAILCALLAEGESVIENIVLSDDITATLKASQALGADIMIEDSLEVPGRKRVTLRSTGYIDILSDSIDCHESGSTARFIIPITRLSEKPVTITGRGRLTERPFGLYRDAFRDRGVSYSDHEGHMPILLEGKMGSGEYHIPGNISSQFISGLLFALPKLEGDSIIHISGTIESKPYLDMTLSSLAKSGIHIKTCQDYETMTIPGKQHYQPLQAPVEGDWSQAAFFCVLGAVTGGIEIKGLRSDSLQGDRVVLDFLCSMGASIHWDRESLFIEPRPLKGIEMDVSQCPDLAPVLAVAASLCEGETVIKNAARLRIKESDRLQAITSELNKLGAKIVETSDGLIIRGIDHFVGCKTIGWNDHRIVMAQAIASAVMTGILELEGHRAVNKSYPEFWDDFIKLGGEIL